jgi:hypothetical protein
MKILRAAAVVMSCVAAVACATGSDGSAIDAGFEAAAPRDSGSLVDASPDDDAITPEDADVADVVDAADAGPAIGSLAYQCPVHASVGCMSASQCESTCIGQYQAGATCTWYSSGGAPNLQPCTAVTQITAVYACPSQLSTNCMDMSLCESTCIGQLQTGSTCSVASTGGSTSSVPCTSDLGQGSVTLYQCPVLASVNCVDTSQCESTCVGQITSEPTCTSYHASAVPNSVNCTALASQTF